MDQGDVAPLGESAGNLRVPVVGSRHAPRINTTGWGPWPSGVARNDGTLVSRSPLVNVTDSSRAVMTDPFACEILLLCRREGFCLAVAYGPGRAYQGGT